MEARTADRIPKLCVPSLRKILRIEQLRTAQIYDIDPSADTVLRGRVIRLVMQKETSWQISDKPIDQGDKTGKAGACDMMQDERLTTEYSKTVECGTRPSPGTSSFELLESSSRTVQSDRGRPLSRMPCLWY
ncbi:hypothetical protein Slin15195_G071260 [Septoria linicola]|uniref:Uncharacterized protein n=1 Tax=Septoria linicola TaxID=215465 RepID=A0A9Q9EKY9_9PEZI|nr:hypothetical protein Slin15195_G071260 [Septoria linicola]